MICTFNTFQGNQTFFHLANLSGILDFRCPLVVHTNNRIPLVRQHDGVIFNAVFRAGDKRSPVYPYNRRQIFICIFRKVDVVCISFICRGVNEVFINRHIIFDFFIIVYILDFNLIAKLISKQPDHRLRTASDIQCQTAQKRN